jgi:hypothetical protein
MNNLFIEGTKSTPAVFFNVEKGILTMSGKSLPEDSNRFYKTIDASLDAFIAERSNGLLIVTCEFEYINTSSSKALYNILKKAVDVLKHNVSIIWGYEDEDEDLKEQGEDFASALGVEFEYKIFAAQ